jgi:DNA processing protein
MGAVTSRAAAVGLASLPDMNPHRLRAIHQAFGFERGWRAVLERRLARHPRTSRCLGDHPVALQAQMADAAKLLDPTAVLTAHVDAGVEVLLLGDDHYPAALAADAEPPAVLFARGDLDVVVGRRVAVIGTRRCTRSGRAIAVELGAELARAGVRVVSGLALGIDGAAHEGALRALGSEPAPVVGVVGCGLDVVYPKRHGELWEAVAGRGLLLSEWPLGSAALPWRFPLRNRIIAALAEVVVVVESHAAGGSLQTVEQAVKRGREVMVVPGSVRNPASRGTNALLFDGAGPVRDAADVLGVLGLTSPTDARPDLTRVPPGDHTVSTPVPDDADRELLDLIGAEPRTLDQLAADSGRRLAELAVTLLRFEQHGWIERSGAWIERAGS